MTNKKCKTLLICKLHSRTKRKTMSLVQHEHCKTKDIDEDEEKVLESTLLLPGLPNHLAQQCLSSLQPTLLFSVCRSWRRLIYSPSFPPFFSLYALLSPRSNMAGSYLTTSPRQYQHSSVEFFCLDPFSSTWKPLPTPPIDTPLHLLHHHPSLISRKFPIQSLTVSGRLVVIAATTHKLLPALTSPIGFDPLTKRWFFGPPLPTPRRWCVTGSVHGAIYVASGMGSSYQSNVARSLEKWDMKGKEIEWSWQKMAAYKDGRFSREAIEAVGVKGKLCMVNAKGNTLKEGAVYNVATNQWEEMPAGMLARWHGPAAVDDDQDVMYMVDESKGALRRYSSDNDSWEVLMVSTDHFKGAEQISAGRGRVCVVCAGGQRVVVVDVVARPARIWVMNPPEEMEVVAIHILPRMCPSRRLINETYTVIKSWQHL